MEVVLAGDIIGSQKNQPIAYLKTIEEVLKRYSSPNRFLIYRGDSFLAWMDRPELALDCVID